jgi:hypothetical protein
LSSITKRLRHHVIEHPLVLAATVPEQVMVVHPAVTVARLIAKLFVIRKSDPADALAVIRSQQEP